jgi:hypothetical protein
LRHEGAFDHSGGACGYLAPLAIAALALVISRDNSDGAARRESYIRRICKPEDVRSSNPFDAADYATDLGLTGADHALCIKTALDK